MKKSHLIGIIVFLLIIMLVLLGSSGDEQPAPTPTPTPTPTPMATPVPARGENQVFKDAFMEGCVEGDSSMKSFCSCTYDDLSANHSIEEMAVMGVQAGEGDYSPEMITSVINCLHLMPEN